jgi:hypothetical protein
VLPGLQSLFGSLAGTPLTPETLLADTVTEIVRQLDPAGAVTARPLWTPIMTWPLPRAPIMSCGS